MRFRVFLTSSFTDLAGSLSRSGLGAVEQLAFPTLNEGDATSEAPFRIPLLSKTTMPPPPPPPMRSSSNNNSLGNPMMLLPIPPYTPGMVAAQSKFKVGARGAGEIIVDYKGRENLVRRHWWSDYTLEVEVRFEWENMYSYYL